MPELLPVYARNVELLAFKRGWGPTRLATELGVTTNTINRLRTCKAKYLDLDLFKELLRVFQCQPNDLLQPHQDVDYTTKP